MRSLPFKTLLPILALHLCGASVTAQIGVKHALSPDLDVEQLTKNVWLHTSWQDVEGFGRVFSHGLIVISEGEALLVDTSWGDSLTMLLLDWVQQDLGVVVRRAVVTHAHDDKMGGIRTLQAAAIAVYGLPETAVFAKERGLPVPDSLLNHLQHLSVGSRTVETFYPGPGHTPDNLTVWLEDERLLFGGCLVRPGDSKSAGYTGDADMAGWPGSIERLASQYPNAATVVPSHGPPGDLQLLRNTLDILENHWIDSTLKSIHACLHWGGEVGDQTAERNEEIEQGVLRDCPEARNDASVAYELYPEDPELAAALVALTDFGYFE